MTASANSTPSASPPALKARSADAAAGLKNLHQLIQLRWIAVVGQVFTIEVAHYVLQLPLPLREMLMVVGCLVLYNAVSFVRWRTGRGVRNVELFLALLVDVAVQVGQKVQAGERIAVIEAMKMENVLFAAADGVVGKILASKGDSLTVDQPIVEFA